MSNSEYRTVEYGEYVLSPCQNVINKKVSYWISKKHHTLALYAFTPIDEKDFEDHLDEASWNSLIKFYEYKLKCMNEGAKIVEY